MSNVLDKSDAINVAVSAATISAPWWERMLEIFARIDAYLLMVGGLIMLFLTIYGKIVEIKIKHRKLRDLENNQH